MPSTSETPNSTTRHLSASQPMSWGTGDLPGTVVRRYSCASEHGGGEMQLSDIHVDGVSGSGPVELVNGGDRIHSGLGLHRHSDGAVSLAAYQMHAERIMANH